MATMIGSTRRLTLGRRTASGRRTRTLGGPRPRRRDRSGVDEPQRWWPGPLIVSLAIVTGFAVVVFLAWLGWSIYVVVHGSPSDLGQFDPDRRCGPLGFSCGAITNILTSVLLIALATFFLLWRIFGLVRQYRGRARADSRELVPTAGTILDDVVGRDELCQVVMADLHERRMRPHVLVGGV